MEGGGERDIRVSIAGLAEVYLSHVVVCRAGLRALGEGADVGLEIAESVAIFPQGEGRFAEEGRKSGISALGVCLQSIIFGVRGPAEEKQTLAEYKRSLCVRTIPGEGLEGGSSCGFVTTLLKKAGRLGMGSLSEYPGRDEAKDEECGSAPAPSAHRSRAGSCGMHR